MEKTIDTLVPAEIKSIPTLEQETERAHFADPRLQNITTAYRAYLKGDGMRIRPLLEELHQAMYACYPFAVASEMARFSIFCSAANDTNIKTGKNGESLRNRKKEVGLNGLPTPTDAHSKRVAKKIIEMEDETNPDPIVATAALGHDVVEDDCVPIDPANVSAGVIHGMELLNLIKTEFHHGKRVAETIDAVTKDEPISDELIDVIVRSDMYAWLSGCPDHDRLKVISSLYKLQSVPIAQYSNDPIECVLQIVRNRKIKGTDAYDNLGSPGTSTASEIRARILALNTGLMGNFKLRHDLLRRVRRNQKNQVDFLHPTNSIEMLNFFTEEKCTQIDNVIAGIIKKEFDIYVTVFTGDWIAHTDQHGKKGSIDFAPVAQSTIVCSPSEFEKVNTRIAELIEHGDFTHLLANPHEKLIADPNSGILKSMTEILGRKRATYSVEGAYSNIPQIYLQLMSNEQFLWNYNGAGPMPPEGKFSVPYSDSAIMPSAILNEMLLYLNPLYLAQANAKRGMSTIVFEEGLFSITPDQELADHCRKIGIDPDQWELLDLIAYSEGTIKSAESLPPLGYLKKK